MRHFVICIRYIIILVAFLLAGCQTEKDYSNIPMIDTHIHLYDPMIPGGIPWPSSQDKVLYKPTLPEHYKKVTTQNGIAATVVVEASDRYKDNEWLLDITAKEKKHYIGIVGNLGVGSPLFEKELKALCQDPRFVGLRLRPNAKYPYFTKKFWQDLKLLSSKGKTLDILMKGMTLSDVSMIAQKNPKLKIIINHLSGMSFKDTNSINDTWRRQISDCASHTNVYCKVSGFFGRAGQNPAPMNLDFYKPCVDHIVKAFGEDRLVYGSNWPVLNKFGNYADYKTLVMDFCQQYDKTFAEKVLYRNALKFYGLPDLK